ncbi:helix-turn-helix domain-containing protein [Streptomyces sp. NPDC048516]|uniref:helix-turn-helix domain-containing protein n=1 Tax=Streptomyces sp. NPDC048516 TaxID=3365565 RepID=UPI00372216D1
MDQTRRQELREFLRTRRARLSPQKAGICGGTGRRRVPGLRREELALLAGVSVDYYIRLERGKAENVSTAVLDSVARVLHLDEAERLHLYALTGVPHEPPTRGNGSGPGVRPGLQAMLDALENSPAYILGPGLTILAWNRLARILIADFPALAPQERNLARLVFLDSAAHERYADWPEKARHTASLLRLEFGREPRKLAPLVKDLTAGSEEFRRLWEEHGVARKTYGPKPLRHPTAGVLELEYETFHPADDSSHSLVAYVAPPGSPTARVLSRLREVPPRAEDGTSPLARS